jgi:hypothetical protein
MWSFRNKQPTYTPPPKLEDAIDFVCDRWRVFQSLEFKAEVSLEEQTLSFIEPALEGLVKRHPEIGLLPTEVVMLIFANGIVRAGTHTALEVQDALGIPRAT